MAVQIDMTWPPADLTEFSRRFGFNDALKKLKDLLINTGIQEESALDLIQQVLFEAIERSRQVLAGESSEQHPLCLFGRFESEEKWWHYLFVVCRNRFKRLKGSHLPQTLGQAELKAIDSSSSIDLFGAGEILDTATPSLTPKQRAVIILLREGFTQSEISQIMGLSRSRVSQLKDSAIKHLRRLLGH
jgi:RNA polymerase sigma factor (sigma-70 family)